MDNYKNGEHSIGVHKVKVTLQYKDYKGDFVARIGGNCKGGSILSNFVDLGEFDERGILENNCKFEYRENDDEYGMFAFTLTNADGETCIIQENPYESNDFVVSVEIISFEED